MDADGSVVLDGSDVVPLDVGSLDNVGAEVVGSSVLSAGAVASAVTVGCGVELLGGGTGAEGERTGATVGLGVAVLGAVGAGVGVSVG